MNHSGIYCITNTINGKKYIGSSQDIYKRMGHHFRLLGYEQHHNTHLQSAFKKYSKESFDKKTLLYCENFELLRYEQYFIDTLKPEYNKNPIAGRTKGRRHSEATKEKLRQRVVSQQTRDRLSISHSGKTQSDDSNKKRSETLKGKIFPAETLAKISAALKGRKFTPEWLEKNRQAQLGKQLSIETKEKIRKASTGRYHTQEEKNKISKANTGRVFTPEHRQHISEAKKKRRDA